MSHHPSLNFHVLSFMPNDLDYRVVLDAGCGFGEWGFLLRTRKSGLPYLIGLDVWRSHLEKLCLIKVYDELLYGRIPPIPLKNKSVDISLACEILEHLSKKMGLGLLAELERVTKELIVVSVPINVSQEEIYGNPYEKHVSKWLLRDFAQLNYETRVVNVFPKTLRIVDGIRRFVFKLPPTITHLIVAQKLLRSRSEV